MNGPNLSPPAGTRACGCKGIRSCRLCMPCDTKEMSITPRRTFHYCIHCKKACHMENTSVQQKCNSWHETSTSQLHQHAATSESHGTSSQLHKHAATSESHGTSTSQLHKHGATSASHGTSTSQLHKHAATSESDGTSTSQLHKHTATSESHGTSTSQLHKHAATSESHGTSTSELYQHAAASESPGNCRTQISVLNNDADTSSVNNLTADPQHLSSKRCLGADSSVDVDSNDMRSKSSCSHNASHMIEFEGIVVLENFVTEEEEAVLVNAVSGTQFVNSQSGRRKQDFGPKVNFKKQKIRAANFTGLPSYSQFLYQRMKADPHLNDFEPVELCNLEYCQHRGAHIEAHFDDAWLWGERLVTLNLLSDSALTFTLDSQPDMAVRVPLSRCSLIVVSAAARHTWKHSILPEDVGDRRIAMTFRELSREFGTGGAREHEGVELLKLALTFSGSAVGS